jgi:hypothetical protein
MPGRGLLADLAVLVVAAIGIAVSFFARRPPEGPKGPPAPEARATPRAEPRSEAAGPTLPSLEPLQVDYLNRNLRVKQRGGKTWNFTAESADALLGFQKAVEAARKRM